MFLLLLFSFLFSFHIRVNSVSSSFFQLEISIYGYSYTFSVLTHAVICEMWISGTRRNHFYSACCLIPLFEDCSITTILMKTIAMQLVRVNCCLNSRNVSIRKCLLYHVLGLLYCLLLIFETHRYLWRSDFYLAFQERKTRVKAAHNYMKSYTSR